MKAWRKDVSSYQAKYMTQLMDEDNIKLQIGSQTYTSMHECTHIYIYTYKAWGKDASSYQQNIDKIDG